MNNSLQHQSQWINDSLWLGGTDATDEGTWLWEDGTASPDTFYLDADNHDNGGKVDNEDEKVSNNDKLL